MSKLIQKKTRQSSEAPEERKKIETKGIADGIKIPVKFLNIVTRIKGSDQSILSLSR